MTEEQLQAIRERYGHLIDKVIVEPYRTKEERSAIVARADARDLLAYVDFLQKLIHDLQSESTAYQRGLELGMAAERERCVRMILADGNAALAVAIREGRELAHEPGWPHPMDPFEHPYRR